MTTGGQRSTAEEPPETRVIFGFLRDITAPIVHADARRSFEEPWIVCGSRSSARLIVAKHQRARLSRVGAPTFRFSGSGQKGVVRMP